MTARPIDVIARAHERDVFVNFYSMKYHDLLELAYSIHEDRGALLEAMREGRADCKVLASVAKQLDMALADINAFAFSAARSRIAMAQRECLDAAALMSAPAPAERSEDASA